jgi:chromosome segregation ATPase
MHHTPTLEAAANRAVHKPVNLQDRETDQTLAPNQSTSEKMETTKHHMLPGDTSLQGLLSKSLFEQQRPLNERLQQQQMQIDELSSLCMQQKNQLEHAQQQISTLAKLLTQRNEQQIRDGQQVAHLTKLTTQQSGLMNYQQQRLTALAGHCDRQSTQTSAQNLALQSLAKQLNTLESSIQTLPKMLSSTLDAQLRDFAKSL